MTTDPSNGMIILGHSRRTNFDDYQHSREALYERGIDYRRMGAAAIGLVRVADGIADLYYERHLNGWDMLAGALIAQEAGAKIAMPDLSDILDGGGPVIAYSAGLESEFVFLCNIEGLASSSR